MALFHDAAKMPSPSERLTILVIRGTTVGSIFLRIFVGIGSSSHDLVLRLHMTAFTWSWVRGTNFLNFGAPVGLHLYGSVLLKL